MPETVSTPDDPTGQEPAVPEAQPGPVADAVPGPGSEPRVPFPDPGLGLAEADAVEPPADGGDLLGRVAIAIDDLFEDSFGPATDEAVD